MKKWAHRSPLTESLYLAFGSWWTLHAWKMLWYSVPYLQDALKLCNLLRNELCRQLCGEQIIYLWLYRRTSCETWTKLRVASNCERNTIAEKSLCISLVLSLLCFIQQFSAVCNLSMAGSNRFQRTSNDVVAFLRISTDCYRLFDSDIVTCTLHANYRVA